MVFPTPAVKYISTYKEQPECITTTDAFQDTRILYGMALEANPDIQLNSAAILQSCQLALQTNPYEWDQSLKKIATVQFHDYGHLSEC